MSVIEATIHDFFTKKGTEGYATDKFRMSYAGRCRLMRFWKRQGKPVTDPFDQKAKGIFEIGNIFHVWIQRVLQESGRLYKAEVMVEDDHRIGHADAIVKTESGLVVYDFKTINAKKFFMLNKNKEEKGDIHYAHQIASYMSMLKNFYDIKDGKIAYISKDDFSIVEVSIFEIKKDIIEESQKDWDILINSWVKQTEPSPNPLVWECNYCSYRSGCEQKNKS